jgi:hypothetical protein
MVQIFWGTRSEHWLDSGLLVGYRAVLCFVSVHGVQQQIDKTFGREGAKDDPAVDQSRRFGSVVDLSELQQKFERVLANLEMIAVASFNLHSGIRQ